MTDCFVVATHDKPYTIALTVLTMVSGLSIIAFYLAHVHYQRALSAH